MYISRNEYLKIISEYEKTLLEKEESFILERNKLYEMHPELKEFEEKIQGLSIKLARLNLSTNQSERQKVKDEIQTEFDNREKYMKSIGLDPSLLSIKHSCETCKDTGFVENAMCHCLKIHFINYQYENTNLKKVFEKENFNTFDFNKYPTIPYQNEVNSPRENIQIIYNAALAFCDHFGDNKNLLFYGQPGLGKTFLCNCIAEKLLNKHYSVLYYTAFELFKDISEHVFNKESTKLDYNPMEGLLDADLLIIDDLGTEFATSLTMSELFNIINVRFIKNKSTIISTNLSLNDLRDKYSTRIYSRILGNYEIFRFFGNDIRVRAKYEK